MPKCIYCQKIVDSNSFVEVDGGWFRMCECCQQLLKSKGKEYLENLYYKIEDDVKD